tara:strand:+ start:84 stop:404 length:321 start_codon:yes stop_codon:yes gene_type:complete
MTIYKQDFPFVEHSRLSANGDQDGDYANSQQELRDRGYAESQIWSVIECDDEYREDGQRISVYVYGPSDHFVNKIGYIATEEHHDGDTYYEEEMEMESYPEDWDDE